MADNTPSPFADIDLRGAIRALKGLNNWTTAQMAEAAGCKPANVGHYLSDRQSMSVVKIEQMLLNLGYKLTITEKES